MFVDSQFWGGRGFFRFEKIDGKWFYIDPDGKPFWSLGVCGVGHYMPTVVTGREHFFSDISDAKYATREKLGKAVGGTVCDFYNFHARNVDFKYASSEKYYDILCSRAKVWGINTLSAWSSKNIMLSEKVPFTLLTSPVWKGFLKPSANLPAHHMDFPEFFNDEFEKRTYANLEKWSSALIKSKWCLGVFMGNEFPWQSETLRLPIAVLSCPKNQDSKIAMRNMLRTKYGEVSRLNDSWKAAFKSWDDFLEVRNFVPDTESARHDLIEFEESLYERFFKVCRESIKRINPNALFIGCKFAWRNDLLMRVASRYCDAISYNEYNVDFSADVRPQGCKDVPIIVGEYHFGSQDRGLPSGGLHSYSTMVERCRRAKYAIESALKNPNIVGLHWFVFADQPVTGSRIRENFSIGFVDICDTPHYDFIKMFREVSDKMYETRFSSPTKP